MDREVLFCGVRTRGILGYKVSAGSDFWSGSVKWCSFLQKWCSEKGRRLHSKNRNKRCGNLGDLINLIV